MAHFYTIRKYGVQGMPAGETAFATKRYVFPWGDRRQGENCIRKIGTVRARPAHPLNGPFPPEGIKMTISRTGTIFISASF